MFGLVKHLSAVATILKIRVALMKSYGEIWISVLLDFLTFVETWNNCVIKDHDLQLKIAKHDYQITLFNAVEHDSKHDVKCYVLLREVKRCFWEESCFCLLSCSQWLFPYIKFKNRYHILIKSEFLLSQNSKRYLGLDRRLCGRTLI